MFLASFSINPSLLKVGFFVLSPVHHANYEILNRTRKGKDDAKVNNKD